MFREQIAVERVITVVKERARAAIAALRDMMRQSGDDEAGETSNAAQSS
jgi:hypothetical protein